MAVGADDFAFPDLRKQRSCSRDVEKSRNLKPLWSDVIKIHGLRRVAASAVRARLLFELPDDCPMAVDSCASSLANQPTVSLSILILGVPVAPGGLRTVPAVRLQTSSLRVPEVEGFWREPSLATRTSSGAHYSQYQLWLGQIRSMQRANGEFDGPTGYGDHSSATSKLPVTPD